MKAKKKIVYKIHELNKSNLTGHITVYSPDADVILLMLLELDKFSIQIMRYDQQLSQLDIIDVGELKKIIINYMKFDNLNNQIKHLIIKDIVMLFTILGNDFLPKIDIVQTNKHIRQILDAYFKLNQHIKSSSESNNYNFIFSSRDNTNLTQIKYIHDINWHQLKNFFINLHNQLKTYNNQFNKYRPSKEWTIKPDQIVNSNAITYYQHVFNIENMANIYEPSINIQKSSTELNSNEFINRISLKYLQGFIWMSEYYLNHNFSYKMFHYKYQYVPTIKQLIYNIERIIKFPIVKNKIINNLNKTIIPEQNYFKPITQLIYISPVNIINIADKKLLNEQIKRIATEWDLKYNVNYELNIENNKINIFDYLNCTDALYLSKCELNKLPEMSSKFILKKLCV